MEVEQPPRGAGEQAGGAGDRERPGPGHHLGGPAEQHAPAAQTHPGERAQRVEGRDRLDVEVGGCVAADRAVVGEVEQQVGVGGVRDVRRQVADPDGDERLSGGDPLEPRRGLGAGQGAEHRGRDHGGLEVRLRHRVPAEAVQHPGEVRRGETRAAVLLRHECRDQAGLGESGPELRRVRGALVEPGSEVVEIAVATEQVVGQLDERLPLLVEDVVGHQRRGSIGSPSTRSLTMLRWISFVPPKIIAARAYQ